MKGIIRSLLCGGMVLLAISAGRTQQICKLQGTIDDFANGDVILFDALTRDTLAKGKIVDHRFTLIPSRGEVNGHALPALVMCLKDDRKQSSAAPVAIENTAMAIVLSGTSTNRYDGSPLQLGYSNLNKNLKEVDDLLMATTDENTRDSLQKVIAREVEAFYIQTRNTSFNQFMALVLYDFIARKFIDPQSLSHIQRMCVDSITHDTFDQMICEAVSGFNDQWEGRKAPDFASESTSGEEVKLSAVIGTRPVIIDFWASWCGPCIKEMPDLKEIASAYNVTIIGVSVDEQVAAWEKSLLRLELPWANIRDASKAIAKQYNVTAVPTKFVIDKNGIIVARNPEDLRAVLESLK
jgi:thiol-disulfide isomerase/thioredoxin